MDLHNFIFIAYFGASVVHIIFCSPFQYLAEGLNIFSSRDSNSFGAIQSGGHYDDRSPYYANPVTPITTKCYQCSDESKDTKKYSPCTSKVLPIVECESEYCYTLKSSKSGKVLKDCGNLEVKDIDLIAEGTTPVGQYLSSILDIIPSILSVTVCARGVFSDSDNHGFEQYCCAGNLCNSTSTMTPVNSFTLLSILFIHLFLLRKSGTNLT